tara:strand:- start:182 stop:2803 length:2622 start_codon:yes stop_codon:yes gene_type:complete
MASTPAPQYTNVNELNILVSAWDYFEKRMLKIQEAAAKKRPPVPFDFERKKNAQGNFYTDQIPLDPILISRAIRGGVADAEQLPNGDWVRNVIPAVVRYGDLINSKFDYVGYVEYAEVQDTDPNSPTFGSMKRRPFPHIAEDPGMTTAEHEDKVAKMTPRLEDIGNSWTDAKSLKCDLCNPEGDEITRYFTYIVQAKEDVQQEGKKLKDTDKNSPTYGKQVPVMLDLKKGEILQLGSGCLKHFMGLDVNKITAFYETTNPQKAVGAYGSPNNPAGWGWKEMGIMDYCDRMVMYYNQREAEWLDIKRMQFWELESPQQIYGPGQLSKLVLTPQYRAKLGDGDGCFIGRKGVYLLKGRIFNIYESDPSKEPRWMIQPYDLKSGAGVVQMMEAWDDGLNNYFEWKTVMKVNPSDGTPEIDPDTGDIVEVEVKVPSSSFILDMLKPSYNYSKGKYMRGEWALSVVPIMPPSVDDKMVARTRDRMLNWIKNLDVSTSEYQGQADLLVRLKNMVELGYVGEKTAQEAPELWRMFMFHDFNRRKKASLRKATKQYKDMVEDREPGRQWFKMDWKDMDWNTQRWWNRYLDSIYGNTGWLRRNALNRNFGLLYLTQFDYDGFEDWKTATELAEKLEQEKRAKDQKYSSAARTIYQDGRWYANPRAIMKAVPYEPSVEEFIDFMAKQNYRNKGSQWEILKDSDRYSMASDLFHYNPTDMTIIRAFLNQDQYDAVVDNFRPTVVTQTGVVPSTPSPAPSPTPATGGKPAIDKQGIMDLVRKARNNWGYTGRKGELLPKVEGYVTSVSKPWGSATRPGRSITLMNEDEQKIYVIFYFGQYLPTVGNYYALYDAKVVGEKSFRGLTQYHIEDENRGQIQFNDITTP